MLQLQFLVSFFCQAILQCLFLFYLSSPGLGFAIAYVAMLLFQTGINRFRTLFCTVVKVAENQCCRLSEDIFILFYKAVKIFIEGFNEVISNFIFDKVMKTGLQ